MLNEIELPDRKQQLSLVDDLLNVSCCFTLEAAQSNHDFDHFSVLLHLIDDGGRDYNPQSSVRACVTNFQPMVDCVRVT
ncbi:hypothetical protein NQZ68_017050 [Dissostichus eleginoides]|nr:hypothetical protein NQZ68_017050 [Dissostichus eleginoides]